MEVLTEITSRAKRVTVKATFNVNLAHRESPPGSLAEQEDAMQGFYVTRDEWAHLRPTVEESFNQILASLDLILPQGSTIDLGEIHVGFEAAE